jgi:dimethylhistidine N-methyltransferase
MEGHKKQFESDIISGLRKDQKKLSSKYFYDDEGDKIFQEIMHLEEYYLPESELEILSEQTDKIISEFSYDTFDVVELGAGDGSKTVIFLERLIALNKNITYYPLDISPEVLVTNIENVKAKLPQLSINPIPGDYFHTLSEIDKHTPKVLLFMGSNIGNYENTHAISFLKKVKQYMQEGDMLMVGIDLRKNPKTILAAYNDSKGVTKRFNLNLLKRINRELGANFDIEKYSHYPMYNPLNGITYSFIISLAKQEVMIGGEIISLEDGETIQTEVSQKYYIQQINQMKEDAGFSMVKHYLDKKEYFSVSVFQ